MSINIGPAPGDDMRPKIVVVGVGGAGGNAIANMMDANIEGVEFIVANTDAQALSNSMAEHRIQLGPDITGGLGAGARPEVGKAAAEETVSEIERALDGANMCFIAAGMGGGTGTGAAPVIAEAARRMGVLTVGVVTKPFQFEGTRRMRAADSGIDELQAHVDTLIVIPNQNLFLVAKPETTFKEAFQLADEVLQQGVRSITDLMVMPGLINLDFADVRSVMQEMGKAMMGTGEADGENRALEAAEKAIANPLLDGVSMAGAKGVIISIIGGEDMKLLEVDEAANHIRDLVDEDANIIWGSAFNPELEGKIRVSVVATGIDGQAAPPRAEVKPFALSEARAPKRPVLELPAMDAEEEGLGEEALELSAGFAEQEFETGGPTSRFDDDEPGEDEDEDAEQEFEDVDGIVDPLEGLRIEEDDDDELTEPAADRGQGVLDGEAGFADREEQPLDLEDEYGPEDQKPGAGGGSADPGKGAGGFATERSGEAGTPGRRRRLVSDPQDEDEDRESDQRNRAAPRRAAAAGGGAGAGSTLFERMANLSRGSSDDDDEDNDEDGGALNIPRFLGRQNNQ